MNSKGVNKLIPYVKINLINKPQTLVCTLLLRTRRINYLKVKLYTILNVVKVTLVTLEKHTGMNMIDRMSMISLTTDTYFLL